VPSTPGLSANELNDYSLISNRCHFTVETLPENLQCLTEVSPLERSKSQNVCFFWKSKPNTMIADTESHNFLTHRTPNSFAIHEYITHIDQCPLWDAQVLLAAMFLIIGADTDRVGLNHSFSSGNFTIQIVIPLFVASTAICREEEEI
jgi:hypothetical protein